MSDTVNPRIENSYLHPKKYAWRADSAAFKPDQDTAPADDKITSVIKEGYKMVINPIYKTDSAPQNGISRAVEEASRKNATPQDVPLDFSVKTVSNIKHVNDSDPEDSFSESPVHRRDNRRSRNSEFHSTFANNHSPPISEYNGKARSSPVPIYGGPVKYQHMDQRHSMNGSSAAAHTDTRPPNPRLCPENGGGAQYSVHDAAFKHGDSMQYNQFPVSNHRMSELHDDSSCDANGTSSPRHSPMLSGENSPDKIPYVTSILHEVLVGASGERPEARGMNSYAQSSHPAETSTMAFQGSMTSSYLGTNSVPPANMMLSDTGSMLQNGGTFIPGSNPFMQAAGYPYMSRYALTPTPLNGMNSFINGNMLSPTCDPRMTLTPATADKKQNKHVRPFKAITSELLCGMPTMGLTPMNAATPSVSFFKDYFHPNARDPVDSPNIIPVPKRDCPEASTSAIKSSPSCSSNDTDLKPDAVGSGDSNCSYLEASASGIDMAQANCNGTKRKRSRTLPEELKDEAYWERRRKNNQAAKRSRDARRQKEDIVAQQAWLFRESNIQMRYQLSGLEEQQQRMQLQYKAITEQCHTLELQLRITRDKLIRNRCAKCGNKMQNISEKKICEPKKTE